jgi:hypothetical protein
MINYLKVSIVFYYDISANLINYTYYNSKMLALPKGISENTYNPATKRDSQDKLHANDMYQKYASQFIKEKHLYLESENLLTTACLRNLSIKKSNLYVVNGNRQTCQEISKVVSNVFCNMSTSYLRRTKHRFGTLWMDYCCTMEGNKYFRPIDDFELILSRRLVQNGGIVGFTFSVRQPKKNWKKRSVKQHKLSISEIKNSKKYRCFHNQKKTMESRKKSRWENATIDFCETVLEKIKSYVSHNIDIEVVDYYRYQYKVKNAPPQMYVFFVRVFYN